VKNIVSRYCFSAIRPCAQWTKY